MVGGCKENPTGPTQQPQPSTISGKIMQAASNNTVSNAIIVDLGALGVSDTSDDQGNYSLSLGVIPSSSYNTALHITASGYADTTYSISVEQGRDLSINLRMRLVDSSKITSGISGQAASIILLSQSVPTIALRGTGKNESCTLTFLVKDSLGNPVVAPNQCIVKFVISVGPHAGEFLLPTSAVTDPLKGTVSTTVTSGTQPYALQVIATTRGDTVKASPIFLAMGGGLPDSAGFSIGATKLNIAGRVYGNLRTTINVSVGDRYGSPVAEGTMVSFRTDPVARLSAFSATTNKEGNATVDLLSTTNRPIGGIVIVDASTMGDKSYRLSDSLISKPMPILFSGYTTLRFGTVDVTTFTIPDGELSSFDLYVSDDLYLPLVEGSTVKITMSAADTIKNDLELLFGVDGVYTFDDTQNPNATHLWVGVLDKGRSKVAGYVTFGIEIKSQNGNYTQPNWFTGYVSTGGQGIFNLPAIIELVDSISRPLYLKETGLRDTIKTLTFVVKDALGNTIKYPTRSRVDFTYLPGPSDTRISKTVDSTNSVGTVSVDIISGDEYGTAQVAAAITGVNGRVSAYSLPIEVAHGLPDSNTVYLSLNKKNMFNNFGNPVGTINLALLDKWGYYAAPQQSSSDIVISPSGGWVTPVPQTVGGKATVTLYGGPEPSDPRPGFGYVRATIRVTGGGTTTKSVPFLFSYTPQIAFPDPLQVDTVSNSLLLPLQDASSQIVDYIVWDKNRNPISSGNSISVQVTGPAAEEVGLAGDISFGSLPDTQDSLYTRFRFTVRDKLPESGIQGTFKIAITVTGESGTTIKTLNGTLLAPNNLGGNTSGFSKSFILVDPLKKRSIYVRGSGGAGSGRQETVALEFEARDSLGRLVDADHAVYDAVCIPGRRLWCDHRAS